MNSSLAHRHSLHKHFAVNICCSWLPSLLPPSFNSKDPLHSAASWGGSRFSLLLGKTSPSKYRNSLSTPQGSCLCGENVPSRSCWLSHGWAPKPSCTHPISSPQTMKLKTNRLRDQSYWTLVTFTTAASVRDRSPRLLLPIKRTLPTTQVHK